MRKHPSLVTLVVACALFMQSLDTTVIATALPAIAHSLGEEPLRLNLAITAYLLSLAVFIPASGWIADRFGARTVLCGAIGLFALGSIACGLAESLLGLVVARVVQGIGGALMVPVGRLVVLRTVPKSELVDAMAFITVPALVGPVIGPPLGGFLTTYASWRWIFWINLPVAVVGIILAFILVTDDRERDLPPFDWTGFVLSALALSGLIFGFETAGRGMLPTPIVAGLIAVGTVLAGLYVHHARRMARPIIDLALLAIPTFRASVAGGTLFRIGIGATPFLLPLTFQLGFGLSPLQSGLLTFAAALGALLMKTTAGLILRQLGFRRVLIVNAVISGAFIVVCMVFRPGMPYALILLILLLGGFFRSLEFTAINTLGYADIPDERMSAATSFASMVQQLSLSLGVTVAALTLHVTQGGGTALDAASFAPAFLLVGTITAASALVFAQLPADAGAALTPRPANRGANH